MQKTYKPKYWNHIGKYQSLYKRLFSNLVPEFGNCDTDHGNILRIVSNLYYDIFNNGGCNFDVLVEDREKLLELVPTHLQADAMLFIMEPSYAYQDDEKYIRFLDRFVDKIIRYVHKETKKDGNNRCLSMQ